MHKEPTHRVGRVSTPGIGAFPSSSTAESLPRSCTGSKASVPAARWRNFSKSGRDEHERQTKMSCFGRNFPRPAFLLPGENRRRTSAYQRDRRNGSIPQRLRAGPRNPLCERLRLRLVGKRPGQEAHGTEEDK